MAAEAARKFACPNCGAIVPAAAKACPDCGSDENTGWSENTYLDGISLGMDDDEYEEIRAREFGGGDGVGGAGAVNARDNKARTKIKLFADINWKVVVGVTVLAAFLSSFVLRGCLGIRFPM